MGGLRPSTKQRRIALALVSSFVTGAALWFVFRRFEWSAFVTQVRDLDPAWVAAAVAADILSYVCQGARWSYLLRPVAANSVLASTRAVYAGLFVNEIVPMRPGEVLRGMIVARETRQPLRRIVPSMVAERVIDAVVLVTAGLLAAAYVPLPASVTEFVVVVGALLLVAGTALGMLRNKIPAAWLEPLSNPSALILSVGVLLGQCLAVWSILRACGLPWSFAAGFAITVILRIGTALPLAPANVGTHQLAMLLGLALFGLTGHQATAVAFIAFALLTLPLLLLGAVALATSHVSVRDATKPRPPVPVVPPGSWTHWKSYPTDNFWWHRP